MESKYIYFGNTLGQCRLRVTYTYANYSCTKCTCLMACMIYNAKFVLICARVLCRNLYVDMHYFYINYLKSNCSNLNVLREILLY